MHLFITKQRENMFDLSPERQSQWHKLETADLITFTEEIFNGNLHLLCSVNRKSDI